MTSTRTRDLYRVAVAAVTGITAAATVTASGWVAGTLTSTSAASGSPAAAPSPNDASGALPSAPRKRIKPKVTVRHRKVVTKVRTVYVDQYVPVAPAPAAAAPAPVRNPAPVHHAAPVSHPAPQPTTTSGS